MTTTGLDIIPGTDMTRIRVACQHQRGLIYVVPAERSWVCNSETLPAHALAGFFRGSNDYAEALLQSHWHLGGGGAGGARDPGVLAIGQYLEQISLNVRVAGVALVAH